MARQRSSTYVPDPNAIGGSTENRKSTGTVVRTGTAIARWWRSSRSRAAVSAPGMPPAARSFASGSSPPRTSSTRSKCQVRTVAPLDAATVSSAGSSVLDCRRMSVGWSAAIASRLRSSSVPTTTASGASHQGVRPTTAPCPPNMQTVRVSAGLRETMRAALPAAGVRSPSTGARPHAAAKASAAVASEARMGCKRSTERMLRKCTRTPDRRIPDTLTMHARLPCHAPFPVHRPR